MLWTLLLAVLTVCLSLCSFYFLFLTIAGVRAVAAPAQKSGKRSALAVLIPAHDEEVMIPRLLTCLQQLDYPKESVDIYVVADNCKDATADVGRQFGAQVYERRNEAEHGKGYALQWLLSEVRACGRTFDGYVFLDADCYVSSNFLDVVDTRLQMGSRVIQTYYTVANPYESSVTALRYVALVLKHYVRPRGRQRLGLSCGLFGTGMAFRSDVLDKFGWDAFTLAEDAEYGMKLIEAGVRIDFAPEATTFSEMPTSLIGSGSQSMRWERGRFQVVWQSAPRVLRRIFSSGALMRLDALLEHAIPPLSVLVALNVVALTLAIVFQQHWIAIVAAASCVALASHVFVGLLIARVPRRAYGALCKAPVLLVWKVLQYGRALLPGDKRWVRTGRPNKNS